MVQILIGLACLNLPQLISGAIFRKTAPYTLPELDFPYDAFEGVFVGSQTMHLHHDRHHAVYVDTLNKAMAGLKEAGRDIELLLQQIQDLPVAVQGVVRNHGGGHMNHALFWKWLKPGGSRMPQGELKEKIVEDFSSFEKFQGAFEAVAAARFGSGWAWLVLKPDKHLDVCSTANQDNPVMDVNIGGCHGMPVLGLDVWEHAYYLDYNNVRPKYVKDFWKIVNWNVVEERFAAAMLKNDVKGGDHSVAVTLHLCPFVVVVVLAYFSCWT
mmetsp:Transcript_101430/g.160387  ORF Transcript_101430/g.160387 Transcript_101430/m.160387 type:complete len:269 (+) Transcript_101430:79-885(+)|eukprot:CAMPEP_0169130696 /NCGR_PEP_ID=MMETSP1015-20121227/37841_1 /TAXON_ID=342587 /ORGANISM="Karlodinium micrum, Strain CCMP2283" /LENGTH=268 /DNA_ID=CAMNT_0009194887 /DNA_START=77 /DNA_END=883 /DNA_ORIENTATION=+